MQTLIIHHKPRDLIYADDICVDKKTLTIKQVKPLFRLAIGSDVVAVIPIVTNLSNLKLKRKYKNKIKTDEKKSNVGRRDRLNNMIISVHSTALSMARLIAYVFWSHRLGKILKTSNHLYCSM